MFDDGDAAYSVAKDFPDTRFVQIDGDESPLENVTTFDFVREGVSYLVGAAAALQSKTGRIGFIGGAQQDTTEKRTRRLHGRGPFHRSRYRSRLGLLGALPRRQKRVVYGRRSGESGGRGHVSIGCRCDPPLGRRGRLRTPMAAAEMTAEPAGIAGSSAQRSMNDGLHLRRTGTDSSPQCGNAGTGLWSTAVSELPRG